MNEYLKYRFWVIGFIALWIPASSFSQLSPGELSQAHSSLEGISNCTQCHELGNKVLNQKCLTCHTEIESLINQQRGYHASDDVLNQDCFECHSEHHGRKFDMIRFNTNLFDHNLAGYELEGQHFVIDCRACHTPDNISDPEIKKRENTFLGMSTKCVSCHNDFHQGSLSGECISCHDMEAFRPAVRFNHDDADFTLKGEHVNVSCVDCHEVGVKNGREFQQFSDVVFNDCNACHNDPHNNQLNAKCSQCHTENGFDNFVGQRTFNHNTTKFKLTGAHNTVNCFDCHTNTRDPRSIFQEQIGTRETQCMQCHEDKHDGNFGTDCASCHNTASFAQLNSEDQFNHSLTDFPLEGMHIGLDCKLCHTTDQLTDPISFTACKNCHADYHNGAFIENGVSPDCNSCHSLLEGFEVSLFGLDRHAETNFPLEGAHIATPCIACHVSEDQWTFSDIGMACVDCHTDIHEGIISEKYYPDQTCTHCHISKSWADVTFNHKLTDWPLEGKHLESDCRSCHFEDSKKVEENMENSSKLVQSFLTLQNDCNHCHENVHDDQFELNGITDCSRCHNSLDWFPYNFDHNSTNFKLLGKHAEIECKACHTPYEELGIKKVDYKIERFECIDCHS